MKVDRFVTLFAVLALALVTLPQEYSPLTDTYAKPSSDQGSRGKGHANKNKSQHTSKDKRKSNALDDDGYGQQYRERPRQFHKGEWDRDWNIDDFLATGFTAAALYKILGINQDLLHTGAHALPPGIRKNLARGKPLPPGIAKKQASADLGSALPRIVGHEWHEIGSDLILIRAGTQIIAQILRDILN